MVTVSRFAAPVTSAGAKVCLSLGRGLKVMASRRTSQHAGPTAIKANTVTTTSKGILRPFLEPRLSFYGESPYLEKSPSASVRWAGLLPIWWITWKGEPNV